MTVMTASAMQANMPVIHEMMIPIAFQTQPPRYLPTTGDLIARVLSAAADASLLYTIAPPVTSHSDAFIQAPLITAKIGPHQ